MSTKTERDLEAVGWYCTGDCRNGSIPCAFHYFSRWTADLDITCSSMNMDRDHVIDGVRAVLLRYISRSKRHADLTEWDRQRIVEEQMQPLIHAPYLGETLPAPTMKPCQLCGAHIPGRGTKYCSDECQRKAHTTKCAENYAATKGGAVRYMTCPTCNALFAANGHMRYCSSQCRKAFHLDKKRALTSRLRVQKAVA